MSFLSPTAIALAAAMTIPPLVALYFLKLKRAVRPVPSTLLWKRAVEDLRVNAPFQRLRGSLLLLLQLAVLLLAALALGKPMLQTVKKYEDVVIIMIDQSASMGVVEADGKTRLETAKQDAKRIIDNLGDNARAMVIAFCDRAIVAASFDSDKTALHRKIDEIEQTQSTSTLSEAMSLAEAHARNFVLAGAAGGSESPPEPAMQPASVFLFTDGRIEDADKVALQKFDLTTIDVRRVGARGDNVGIVAMDARRNYERPEMLEVAATVQNFSAQTVNSDVVLYIDGRALDIQTIRLEPAVPQAGTLPQAGSVVTGNAAPGDVAVVAFDEIAFEGGGVVEVVVRVDDALPADDRAWTIVDEPRRVRVLLVTPENPLLESVLAVLPVHLTTMTPEQYEAAKEDALAENDRSAFELVILDRHSTARLPHGNYFFWAAVPLVEGASAGRVINDEVIVNWDETHPVLRHVAVETLSVMQWVALKLSASAVPIIDGESTPVLSYFTRDASQFLISAFSLIVEDSAGTLRYNTDWVASVDFVVFMHNAVQFLTANLATVGKRSVLPGEPVTLPVPPRTPEVRIARPDGTEEAISATDSATINYARTRQVGAYRVEPSAWGAHAFAVNLFNPVESRVEPATTLTLGTEQVPTRAGSAEVNRPAWRYVMLMLLAFLLLEWFIYNLRVFV